jgi:hypothetical protein
MTDGAFDRGDFDRALAALHDPRATLTGEAIAVLYEFLGPSATRLLEARVKATVPPPPRPSTRRAPVGVSEEALATIIVETVKRAIAPVQARIATLDAERRALETRVLELEAREATIPDPDHVPR